METERPAGGASARGPCWWLVAGGQPGAFSTISVPEAKEPCKDTFTDLVLGAVADVCINQTTKIDSNINREIKLFI